MQIIDSMRMFKQRNEKGFTLIELLVVIAIIGVLASVVLASLTAARDRANNAKRRADLVQIRNALQLFYQDNGAYPNTGGAFRGTTLGCQNATGDPNWAIPGLAPTYLARVPQDPRPNPPWGCYLYTSDGNEYKVMVHTTVAGGNVPQTDPMARWPLQCGAGAVQATYAVYTPGTVCW